MSLSGGRCTCIRLSKCSECITKMACGCKQNCRHPHLGCNVTCCGACRSSPFNAASIRDTAPGPGPYDICKHYQITPRVHAKVLQVWADSDSTCQNAAEAGTSTKVVAERMPKDQGKSLCCWRGAMCRSEGEAKALSQLSLRVNVIVCVCPPFQRLPLLPLLMFKSRCTSDALDCNRAGCEGMDSAEMVVSKELPLPPGPCAAFRICTYAVTQHLLVYCAVQTPVQKCKPSR